MNYCKESLQELQYKALREQKEATREGLALAVGITESNLEAYENGAREPRDEIKTLLAMALDTTIESLFYSPEEASNERIILADNVRRLILEKQELSIEAVVGLCRALGCTPNTLYGME